MHDNRIIGASADKALLLTLYALNEQQGSLHALLLPCTHAEDTSHCSHVSTVCADLSINHTLCRGL